MQFARVIRLDESDAEVYDPPADAGEWAISGAFAFSDWSKDDISDGKVREAFRHGWLGLGSFGRASIVAVAPITPQEREELVETLAQHFLSSFGAPSIEAARPVAEDEIAHMQTMCEDHDPNTMIVVERSLEDVGVREKFRLIPPKSASLEAFAVHGSLDDP